MSLPKEPRQKMINMMYLVLTALLALNVSAEILNAFKTVNGSLQNANIVISDKNKTVYDNFEAKLKKPETHDKAALWQPKALAAQKLSLETYNYLETLKQDLKKESDLKIVNGEEDYKIDNLDAATRLLVDGPKGKELLDRLTAYKQNLLDVLKPEEFNSPDQATIKQDIISAKENFKKSLPLNLTIPPSTNEANKGNWQSTYFRMTPTIAAITILSKFQNDIKNSESQIVDYCFKKVGEVVLEYDQFQAIASQSSEYLMPGQEMTITGGVGAFSKSAAPSVTIDGSSVPLNAQGVAERKFTVEGPGSYSKKVRITFKKPDGTDGSLEKEIKYTVGSPTGVSVSADAVKALYIGLENPLTISGGTKGDEAVQAQISQGSVDKKGGGKYMAKVENPGKATLRVTVDGKPTDFEFKVKRVPDPTPMVGQFGGGTVSVNAFKANVGVRADLKDFVFENVTYTVTGFTIVCTGKGFETTGPKFAIVKGTAYFSSEAKQYIEMCKAGSSVNITDITVSGPDGSRKLNASMAFNLSN